MASDVYTPPLVGSTDWAGGRAPAGGSQTGVCTLTMRDGAQFTVAHTIGEALAKIDSEVQRNSPAWVAFDMPFTAIPVVLNAAQIGLLQVAPELALPTVLSPTTFLSDGGPGVAR